jgi:hypothetical protein
MLRRLRVDMCRAACRLSTRRARVLWRLHVLGVCRAVCRVSTRFSRLCFSTARDTRKRKTAKQNSKCSHVSNCPAFALQTARKKWAHRISEIPEKLGRGNPEVISDR